jgi:hypothetical protein
MNAGAMVGIIGARFAATKITSKKKKRKQERKETNEYKRNNKPRTNARVETLKCDDETVVTYGKEIHESWIEGNKLGTE